MSRPLRRALRLAALPLLAIGVLPGGQLFAEPTAFAQSAARPWLGLELAARKDGGAGVLVRHALRTSPSDKAGIKDGDIVTTVNGKTVATPGEIISEVRAHAPGDDVPVVILRATREIRLTVTLAAAPPPDEMVRRDKVGTFSPPITGLSAVQGNVPATIGAMRGKVVVLDFWAGWCGVCKLMTPTLNEWQSKFGAQGLVVLGVSSDKHDVATKATKTFGITYAVGADTSDKVFPGFNVPALPTMYILDKGGVVREIEVGFDAAHLKQTEKLIEKLLAEKTPLGGGFWLRRVSFLFIVTELLWTLRRAGLVVSTAEAIDLFRAFGRLGFDDRDALLGATEAVLGRSRADVALIRATFARFFRVDAEHGRDSRGRLVRAGFSADELTAVERVLRDMLTVSGSEEAAVLLALLAGGPEIAALVRSAAMRRAADGAQNAGEIGYFTEQAARLLGVPDATKQLAAVKGELRRELGEDRADALLAALAGELRTTRTDVRAFVESVLGEKLAASAPKPGDARTMPFATLTDDERVEVERAVRLLAERLRGGARVRFRRRGRGALDARRTIARSLRTGGVPTSLIRKVRRAERPKLWVLCDVSDSVRSAATFLLAFVAAVTELFAEVRAFVFVSDLVEITGLLRSSPFPLVVSRLASGSVLSLHETSHYGRVLASFEGRHAREIGRRDVLVILGDGRTNHRPPRADIVARLRDRAGATYWLCPEPLGAWGVGDSAMRAYAGAVTLALPAASARDLEVAARRLVHG